MTGEWTKEKTMDLIAKYRERKALWDPTHNSYYKSYKNKAVLWDQLAREMGISVAETRRRMQSLLASMRRERARVRRSLAESGEQYKSTWFAYDSLSFLLERPNPLSYKNPNDSTYEAYNTKDDSESGITLAELIARQIALSDPSDGNKCEEDSLLESNGMTKVETSDGDAEERSDCGQEESTSRRKRRKVELINNGRKARKIKISPAQSDNFDEGNLDRISDCGPAEDYGNQRGRSARQSDDCVSFGRYIADKLKTYNWATKCAVQHTISEVLFNADQGRFETFCSYSANDTDARVLLRTAVEDDKPVEETLPSSAGSPAAGGAED